MTLTNQRQNWITSVLNCGGLEWINGQQIDNTATQSS